MKLKFFQDAVYNGQLLYRIGDVVEIDDKHGMATRWLVRGKAKIFVEPIVEVPVVKFDAEFIVEPFIGYSEPFIGYALGPIVEPVFKEVLVPFCQEVEEEIVPVVEPPITTTENQSIAIKSQKVETKKGKKKI